MSSGHSRGLPIFHDDLSFNDRHQNTFRDIQRRMDEDFGRGGFGRPFDRWNMDDEMSRLVGDFQQLKPRNTRMADVAKDDFGSKESLDDNSTNRNMYVEHPQTKSRTFHMSFDVKDYNPSDITVKAEGDTLMISARHEEDVGGHVNVREFNRKIKIPKDVDGDKLSSTLSNDGILTVQAPVPPKYTSVAYINPTAAVTSNGATGGGQQYQAPRNQPAPAQQYPYTQPSQPTHQPPQLSQMSSHTPSPPPQHQPRAQIPPPQAQAPHVQTQTRPQLYIPPPQQHTPVALEPPTPPPLFHQPEPLPVPLDTPVFRDSANGKGREFELALEVSRPFTPEDVVVKLEGKSLTVEATHDEKAHGKSSTSTMSRNFDLTEDLDPGSVEAMLRSDGCLLIKGVALPNT